jgi:hypothetical protein
MTAVRKVEMGVLVTIALAVISFTFWLGSLSQKVTTLEERMGKLEATLDQRIAMPGPPSPAPGPSAVTLNLPPDVDRQHVPFKVNVNGTVAGARDLYTYVVVDDGNAEWIQPGLGYNRDGAFYSTAYLGLERGEASLNKWYSVFAVITNSEHKQYAHLDAATVRARTEPIRLYRTR